MVRLGLGPGRVLIVFSSTNWSEISDALEAARGVRAPPAIESIDRRWTASGMGSAENSEESVPVPRGDDDN